MKEYKNIISTSIPPFFRENYIFFDIETTGLHPKSSMLYLIGLLYFDGKVLRKIQIFNEDGETEKEVIECFLSYLKENTTLIHYNGTTFDLPYIKTRCEFLGIAKEILDSISQCDCYTFLRPLKKVFHLDNGKQQTLERLIGFTRSDQLSGKQLIEQYFLYLKLKKESYLDQLLLHNSNDLEGLAHLSFLLTLSSNIHTMPEHQFTYHCSQDSNNQPYIEYELPLPYAVPFSLHVEKNFSFFLPKNQGQNHKMEDAPSCTISLSIQEETIHIRCPLLHSELKFFYPNYKDYYYLPFEDMAIHKSVASFVDKEHRQKAKKETCYIKKTGTFIPLFEPISGNLFYKEYGDKRSFLCLDSTYSESIQKECVLQVFRFFSLPEFPHSF